MKFKNIKKKAKKSKSPSNSRIISSSVDRAELKFSLQKLNYTALLKTYRASLKIFVISIFIVTAIIVGMDLQKNLNLKQNIDIQRENLTKELKFWKDFINEHQDYRDAYFQASVLEYRLGNTSKAKKYVEKGLSLDPNSEDGKKLEDFLVNK